MSMYLQWYVDICKSNYMPQTIYLLALIYPKIHLVSHTCDHCGRCGFGSLCIGVLFYVCDVRIKKMVERF